MIISNKKFVENYSYEDWIIDFSDLLIKLTTSKKEINKSYLQLFGVPNTNLKELETIKSKLSLFSPNVIDYDFNNFNNFLNQVSEDIKNHLVYNDYITILENTWILTERGLLVKELKGHKKFVKHRHRELSVLKNQSLINWGLLIVALISAAMPLVVEWTKPNKPTEIFFNKKIDSVIIKQTQILDTVKTDIHDMMNSIKSLKSN